MINGLEHITNNGYEAIFAGVTAAFVAQLIKFFTFLIIHKKINFKIVTTTGGMPSSHSAGVVALATAVGLVGGFDSLSFAVAFGIAVVTMYDAAGVRRAAGKTAASLNRIMEDFYKQDVHAIAPKLKELLGHTPVEVIVGAIFGAGFAICLHDFLIG